MAKRSVGLGFVISAVDKASKEFRGFGKNVTGSLGSIKAALMMQHPALALLRQGWRLVSHAISDAVKTALQFQTAAVRQEFAEFGKSVDLVKARIGDALLPTIRAFMESLKPAVDRTRAWLTVNNQLVASKVLDWTLSVARFLVNYVVPALGWVAKGFLGVRMVIDLVMFQFNKLQEILSLGWEKILSTAAKLARLVGADGLAGGLEEAAAFAQSWRESFGESAAANLADLEAQVDAIDTMDRAATFLRDALNGVVSDAALNGQKNLRSAVVGGTTSLKEQEEQAKKNKEANDELARAESRMDAARRLARAKSAAYNKAEHDEKMRLVHLIAVQRAEEANASEARAALILEATTRNMDYAASMGSVFGAIASGTMKQADATKAASLAVIDIVEREVERQIMAYAAAAAAKAADSQAAIPVIGPILAAAAAAAVFAMVRGYLSKFHEGGKVPGQRGRETMILALGGEEVLTDDDPRHIDNFARQRRESIGASANRGSSISPAAVQKFSLNVSIHSVAPDSEVAFERKTQTILRRIQRAVDSGELRLAVP